MFLPSKECIDNFFKGVVLRSSLNDKEKINAKLRYAVWSGKIIKPKECSKCGDDTNRICGHHHKGYSKENALNVIWLCDRCHHAEHRKY